MLKASTGDFGMFQYNDTTTGLRFNNVLDVWPRTQFEDYQTIRKQMEPNYRATSLPTPNKEVRKMANKNKRGLFQVILINPKEGKVIFNEYVICSKPEDVLLEANAGDVIKKAGLAVSEVDKIVNLLGEVRNVKKNKDGIVELVNEDNQE